MILGNIFYLFNNYVIVLFTCAVISVAGSVNDDPLLCSELPKQTAHFATKTAYEAVDKASQVQEQFNNEGKC